MREWRYSATDSETQHQIESSGQLHTPKALAPFEREPGTPSTGGLDEGSRRRVPRRREKYLTPNPKSNHYLLAVHFVAYSLLQRILLTL
jgi:hypothetical protein